MRIRHISILFALLLVGSVLAPAEQLLGTLITVNNTTSNSTAVSVGTITVPPQSITVQTAGLTATNALVINSQVSLDGTNFVNIKSYYMTSTNAGSETFNTGYTNQTIYFRVSATTTNSVNLSVTRQ